MSLCFDCGKVNKDEALKAAKQEAKRLAIQNNEPIAVYKDGDEYKYINAYTAINDGIPYLVILSQHN